MNRWQTKEVVKLLKTISTDGIGKVTVTVDGPGGDCDSDNLVVEAKNANVSFGVCGFRTDCDVTTPSDLEVEMVEVTDGGDSQGGLNSHEDVDALLYARVCRTLTDAGFSVVRSLKAYF